MTEELGFSMKGATFRLISRKLAELVAQLIDDPDRLTALVGALEVAGPARSACSCRKVSHRLEGPRFRAWRFPAGWTRPVER
jgi:hypothetical protein